MLLERGQTAEIKWIQAECLICPPLSSSDITSIGEPECMNCEEIDL